MPFALIIRYKVKFLVIISNGILLQKISNIAIYFYPVQSKLEKFYIQIDLKGVIKKWSRKLNVKK